MKESDLAIAAHAIEFRSRATRDLDVLQKVEKRGHILAETSFFSDRDDDRNRVFSDDGKSTRLPFDSGAFDEFSRRILASTRAYLQREIECCNETLKSLGIEVEQ